MPDSATLPSGPIISQPQRTRSWWPSMTCRRRRRTPRSAPGRRRGTGRRQLGDGSGFHRRRIPVHFACIAYRLNRKNKSGRLRGPITEDGGGGRNRTAVRRHSMPGTTCLARCLISDGGNTTCEAHRHPYPLSLSPGWRVAAEAYPVMMTLHPRAQAQVGSGLGLKRPERSCRRWQL